MRKEVCLSVQADPRSPERGQYGFVQDLVRTVAYETLSKRERKSSHLSAARYLVASCGAEEHEIVEVVASHYVDAYRVAPEADDAREIGEQARRMLVRAGERAASLAAAAEARAYFQQARPASASGRRAQANALRVPRGRDRRERDALPDDWMIQPPPR